MAHNNPPPRGDLHLDSIGRVGRLLTVDEVADVLGTCTRTARRLIWRGELASLRVGRLVRVEVPASRAYLDGQAQALRSSMSR